MSEVWTAETAARLMDRRRWRFCHRRMFAPCLQTTGLPKGGMLILHKTAIVVYSVLYYSRTIITNHYNMKVLDEGFNGDVPCN